MGGFYGRNVDVAKVDGMLRKKSQEVEAIVTLLVHYDESLGANAAETARLREHTLAVCRHTHTRLQSVLETWATNFGERLTNLTQRIEAAETGVSPAVCSKLQELQQLVQQTDAGTQAELKKTTALIRTVQNKLNQTVSERQDALSLGLADTLFQLIIEIRVLTATLTYARDENPKTARSINVIAVACQTEQKTQFGTLRTLLDQLRVHLLSNDSAMQECMATATDARRVAHALTTTLSHPNPALYARSTAKVQLSQAYFTHLDTCIEKLQIDESELRTIASQNLSKHSHIVLYLQAELHKLASSTKDDLNTLQSLYRELLAAVHNSPEFGLASQLSDIHLGPSPSSLPQGGKTAQDSLAVNLNLFTASLAGTSS